MFHKTIIVIALTGALSCLAQQAIGQGIRAKRSKAGAISFDLLTVEDGHAAV